MLTCLFHSPILAGLFCHCLSYLRFVAVSIMRLDADFEMSSPYWSVIFSAAFKLDEEMFTLAVVPGIWRI